MKGTMYPVNCSELTSPICKNKLLQPRCHSRPKLIIEVLAKVNHSTTQTQDCFSAPSMSWDILDVKNHGFPETLLLHFFFLKSFPNTLFKQLELVLLKPFNQTCLSSQIELSFFFP